MANDEETIRRRIQLIAGSTYSVSLPKKWVLQNRLKEKDEVAIHQRGDNSLVVMPGAEASAKNNESFNLVIEEYKEDIIQVLYVLYYLGFQKVTVKSKSGFTLEQRLKVKESLRHMVGTEIFHEDEQSIVFNVLLEKSKVNINQLFYRTALIIGSSIDILLERGNHEEIRRNEDELDRLYNLISKIIFLSHTSPEVLVTSGIGYTHLFSPYLLTGKKLENISDEIEKLAAHLKRKKQADPRMRSALAFLKENLHENMKFFMKAEMTGFTKTEPGRVDKIRSSADRIADLTVRKHIMDCLRLVVDIEEELTTVSFYRRLIADKVI